MIGIGMSPLGAAVGAASGFPSSGLLSKTVGLFIPSAAGTTFTTHDGSTEVASNADRIGRVEAHIGTGADFLQTTADNRPYYGVSGAVKYMYASAVENHLASTASEYKINGDVTLMAWVRSQAEFSWGYIIGSMTSPGSSNLYEFRLSNGVGVTMQLVQADSGAGVGIASPDLVIGAGADALVIASRDQTANEIDFTRQTTGGTASETETYTVEIGAATATSTTVLGRADAGLSGVARLYAWGVFTAPLTSGEIAEVNAEVEALSGVAFS